MSRLSVIVICASAVVVMLSLVASQLLWLKYNGTPVPVPDIPRGKHTVSAGGTKNDGPALTYVILGDSTSIAQGARYAEGYAAQSATYLAQTHTVTWQNVGVSGARAADVLHDQLPQAIALKPDVALVAVGANDVTHVTSNNSVVASLQSVIQQLRKANPHVYIVLTGSPDMGSPPRLPQPLRWIAGKRTVGLNKRIVTLAEKNHVTFAPIAVKTGPTFRKHPELFAQDHFHPNAQGYKLWTPVIIDALSQR